MGTFFDTWSVSPLLRLVGRPAFPIFCFLITYHLNQGVPVSKYLKRVGIFALISAGVTGVLAGDMSAFLQMNVLVSLWLGIAAVMVISRELRPDWMNDPVLYIPLFLLVLLASVPFGYSAPGVLYLLSFYYCVKNGTLIPFLLAVTLTLWVESEYISYAFIAAVTTVLLCVVPVKPSGRGRLKWYWYYAYFPVHLMVLGGLKMWLG